MGVEALKGINKALRNFWKALEVLNVLKSRFRLATYTSQEPKNRPRLDTATWTS